MPICNQWLKYHLNLGLLNLEFSGATHRSQTNKLRNKNLCKNNRVSFSALGKPVANYLSALEFTITLLVLECNVYIACIGYTLPSSYVGCIIYIVIKGSCLKPD